ncbi:ABC transporter ATP-binding protein [Leifsonia shinshuensis]|uniref:ABC transporter ATP-binding protein n=1 Tax=Leifsonia shinshuensis TaxID=150026 RepID=A0A7G6YA96_9MICO|nr:ABC transporter ATP-binding protein [Leifsonia shinshuensis]QNE35411.1 ABC transporter ATP-binding protein [Leifsonia shinshuensis]
MSAVLEIDDLRVELLSGREILHGVSLTADAGEIVALVGESGSGKTTIGTTVLGHLRPGAQVTGGEIRIRGRNIFDLSDRELRALRGSEVAFVSQDPASALSPTRRIGRHFEELGQTHLADLDREQLTERISTVLADVNLPSSKEFLRKYPHQLSGGQLQRVIIALAFLVRPSVVVLDEITTGLDVSTQSKVLETVRTLCHSNQVVALYVTHDLSVVRELADRVIVLEEGDVVEDRDSVELFGQPAHDYTKRLLGAIPDIAGRRLLTSTREATDGAPAVLEIRGVDAWYGTKQVLFEVDLRVTSGSCVALVGESGSGKSTLSRSIVGLNSNWSGDIEFGGEKLATKVRARIASERREIQYIFQSADRALNPRLSVMDSVLVPIQQFFGLRGAAAREKALEAFEKVALSASLVDRRPRELSGGERQRAAIARAIACEPRMLICDEVTSALDVSVQAVILSLLDRLRDEEKLSMLFVTHNLAVVREIANDVVVLKDGRVVETGSVDAVLDSPRADYTRRLLADTPSLFRTLPTRR